MRRPNRRPVLYLITAVALVAAVLACLPGCAPSAAKEDTPPPPEVIVSKPVSQEVTDYFEFPGRMEAFHKVEVRAQVTGYIVKVNFQDGQVVKKGDVLFRIDPRPYQAAWDRAKAELARWEALKAKAQADLARAERLRPTGAVSQEEYELDVSQLKVAEASIAAANAAIEEARTNLDHTTITAEISGRVSQARLKEGNLVQPAMTDISVLTTIVTTSPIYACFNIDERALLKYKELGPDRELHPRRLKEMKLPVEVGLANEQGFPHVGVLDFIDNELNPKTGSIRAKGLLPNDNEELTAGLFVRVRIPFGKPHQALLVSDRAIGTDQREKFLLVVDKDQKVKRCLVTVGRVQSGLRVIESGIGPDDLVIVKGLQRARPGIEVAPRLEQAVAGSPSPAQVGKSDEAPSGGAVKN
jgi:RND family efflux transporter MFP subunit